MTLLEFQRRMAEDVSRPLTAGFMMQEVGPDGSSVAESVANYVKPNGRLSSFERLEIYNRQYWFRLIAAVSEDFPALNAMLGPKRFDELILNYLEENPSTSFNLRDLGAQLPSWLEDHPEFTGAHLDLAVDVARLEWAYIEAFDRAAMPPLDETDLAALQPTSVLALQPHLQLLALRYAAEKVVLAVHKNKPDVDIVSSAVIERKTSRQVRLPKPRRSLTYLVVHRYQNSVYYRRIDRGAFLLLSAIREGKPLAIVVDKAFCQSGLLPSARAKKIRQYFVHAAELGWLIANPA
ncbi:DNA-binding domain-containing protein [Granulicella sp. L46]|uniref:HvfC/BufC N-terminal domain-containing protein n=1 Tax=Granulicella sp. L46 TaxID=1641865 RepID=UPI00131C5615|nr:DNA-binding domain-containing protein [Granulicella sp. L46]